MPRVLSALLVIVAVIHLLPLVGALGPERLRILYGLSFDEPNLLILMRHRAVLFGLLGAFLLAAAWQPALTTMALLAGFVSVLSFLGFALTAGDHNAWLGRVIVADAVALLCLVAAALLHVWPCLASWLPGDPGVRPGR